MGWWDEQPEQRRDAINAALNSPLGQECLAYAASGLGVHTTVGSLYEDVSLLAESLRHLVQDFEETILDGWEDMPGENDGYISIDRGRFHVSLEGIPVGNFPTREVAEIELARAMVAAGVFPNAWFSDRGDHLDIHDDIRRWHSDGGDQMTSLPGVQYQPGDRVWHAHLDWPHIVVGDWGPAGVEIYTEGDPSVRCHVTDRDNLRPDSA
jgi:hypothetical protein